MSKDYMEEAREILGVDLNQSIHHMIGYWYATSPSETFNTELAIAMIEVVLKEMRNPVGIEANENIALQKENEQQKATIKELAAALEFYEVKKSLWWGVAYKALEKNKEMIKGE